MATEQKQLSVAEILRNARSKSSVRREIGTIAKKLCIRTEWLEALESGDYGAFKDEVYIFGFARNYATELKLNPDEIIKQIKQELHPEKEIEEKIIVKEEVKSDAAPALLKISKNCENIAKKTIKKIAVSKRTTCIVAGAAVIVGIGAIFTFGESTDTKNVPEIIEAPKSFFGIATANEYNVRAKDFAVVAIQATRESWVKIENAVSHEVIFSQVLMPGDVFYVSPDTRTLLATGNAGGLSFYVDKKLLGVAGADGMRRTNIKLDAESLRAKYAPAQPVQIVAPVATTVVANPTTEE